MASLRETKDRIASVKNTLKITSAMKLVSSAKLHKAQKAIEGMRPYERELEGILSRIKSPEFESKEGSKGKVAIVAFASNSSLCGAFNNNIIRKTLEVIKDQEEEVCVIAVGRKMAEALRKRGYDCGEDNSKLVNFAPYKDVAEFADKLNAGFYSGEFSKVILVYNRFESLAHQVPTEEQYLPYKAPKTVVEENNEEEYIFEPEAPKIAEEMLPQLLKLKFYAAVLDSEAAEQAARTIAMQTASDNGDRLLTELTLEYNKGRQQKITAEILDLVGGMSQ
ncbi:MAG: ATP synthase F1 subunit gamma [Bacteroidales bacterium]|nr:ATP synthase F1 subunit gamma [Bacteroidales bacterium]